ncbi:MAG: protein-tyrosine phosphatase-like protein [Piptocephalis tieghemiana]|nr:MAG: protein-tyrosine phosphatase-like protein [Piptocephalis tieghemiana]
MPPQSTPSSVSPDPSQPIILPQSVPQLTESPSPAQGNPLPSPPSSSPPISKLAPGSGVLKKRNAKNLSLALPSRADSTSALSAPSTPFLGGPGSRQGLLAAGVTPRVASFGGITDNRGPPSSVFRRASDACLPSASSSSPSPSVFGLPLGPDEADPYRDGPVEILPGIYLGTEVNAADPQVLAKFRIGYVLNVAKEVSLPWDPHHILISPHADIPIIEAPSSSSSSSSSAIHHPPTHTISGPLRYKKFAWGHNQENLADFFDSAFAYLDEAKSRGVGALVHCQCGVSRSASLILAYVMRERTWPLHQAYTYVKNLSSAISPNMSLVYQLVEFERVLGVHRREEDGPLPREEEMSDNEPRGLDRLPEEPVSLCTP